METKAKSFGRVRDEAKSFGPVWGVKRWRREFCESRRQNEEFGKIGVEGEDEKSFVWVKDENEEFWVSRRGRERFVGLKLMDEKSKRAKKTSSWV